MIRKIFNCFIAVAFVLLIPSASSAQTTYSGGRGLFRVFSAETIQSGSIFYNTYYTAFLRSEDSQAFGSDQNFNLGLTYGISNSIELTAHVVPYQDAQRHNRFSPGNTQIGLKWQLPVLLSSFLTGVRGFIGIPTARNPNSPFEPYSSSHFSVGVMGLITVDLSRNLTDLPIKFHSNIGYLEHNIVSVFSKDATDQLLIGFGFKIPVRPFIYYAEYTGEIFLDNDELNFRDNSMRLTQGIKFSGPFRIIVDLGFELSLSRKLESYPTDLIHEYADWKIIAGLNYQINTNKVYGNPPKVAKIDQKKEEKLLQEIKRKREQANKDLEEANKKLKKKKPEKKL